MQYLHSAQPFSIAVELDNLMLGTAALKRFLQQFDNAGNEGADKEPSRAADFCQRVVWDALDDRLATAVDLARRGEIEVTAADVLKVCQWAKEDRSARDMPQDTLDLVIAVAEMFAKSEGARAKTDRPKRSKAKVRAA